MHEGVPDITSTKFFYPEKDNSRRPPSQPVQQTMIMERLLHRIASCCAAADDANQECTRKLEEAVQSCSTTNSINDMGREGMKFLVFSHTTGRITRFLHCLRHFNFNVMERAGLSCHCLSDNNLCYGVHFLLVLKAECHVLPRRLPPQ